MEFLHLSGRKERKIRNESGKEREYATRIGDCWAGGGCGVGCWMKQTRKNPNQSGVAGEGRRAQELSG